MVAEEEDKNDRLDEKEKSTRKTNDDREGEKYAEFEGEGEGRVINWGGVGVAAKNLEMVAQSCTWQRRLSSACEKRILATLYLFKFAL